MIIGIATAIAVFVGVVSALGMIGFAWAALVGLLHLVLRTDARLAKPPA